MKKKKKKKKKKSFSQIISNAIKYNLLLINNNQLIV